VTTVVSLTHCHKKRLFLSSLIFNPIAQLNKESNYCPLLPDVVFNESVQSIIQIYGIKLINKNEFLSYMLTEDSQRIDRSQSPIRTAITRERDFRGETCGRIP